MIVALDFPDDDERRELEALAQIDGVSLADAIRVAIKAQLDERRADPEFAERTRRLMAENADVLNRLGA